MHAMRWFRPHRAQPDPRLKAEDGDRGKISLAFRPDPDPHGAPPSHLRQHGVPPGMTVRRQ